MRLTIQSLLLIALMAGSGSAFAAKDAVDGVEVGRLPVFSPNSANSTEPAAVAADVELMRRLRELINGLKGEPVPEGCMEG